MCLRTLLIVVPASVRDRVFKRTLDPVIIIKMGIAAPTCNARLRDARMRGKTPAVKNERCWVFNMRIRQDMTFLAALYVTLKQSCFHRAREEIRHCVQSLSWE